LAHRCVFAGTALRGYESYTWSVRARGTSKAFQDLDAVLQDRGYEIPSTRIENWCYWGSTGLVDRPQRRGAGRGTTSSFVDVNAAADQAIAVSEFLRRRDSLDLVALRLSASGHHVDENDIKSACLRVLDALEAKFARDARASETDDPIELAANVGWAAHRALTRGSGAQARRKGGLDARPEAWVVVGRVLLGDPFPHTDVEELLLATGLGRVVGAFSEGVPYVAEAIASSLTFFSFPAIRLTLMAAAPGEIVDALRNAYELERWLTRLVPTLAESYSMDSLRLGAAVTLLTFPMPSFGKDLRTLTPTT